MLRITVREEHGWATLRVEGLLVGAWVPELERCWQDTLVSPDQIVVDLDDLLFMDRPGRALLARMHAAGTQLHARGLLTGYIVEQIQAGNAAPAVEGRAS
jgi:hypothetical protein